MRSIGIIHKCADAAAIAAARSLVLWLQRQGCLATVTSEVADPNQVDSGLVRVAAQDHLADGQDLVVVIGGDGTFIAAARAVGERSVPLLGINMGRLGFLTEVPVEAMLATMAQVLSGHYAIEQRTMLCATVYRHGAQVLSRHVLNDIVAHKGALARMVEYAVSIDGQFVFSSRSDGLIVATPTGSTAYALSSGGPIIYPALDVILLAPICPHTLSNRPIVVPGQGVITLEMVSDHNDRLLTLDGQVGFPLEEGDRIQIQRCDQRLSLLHAPDRNYYDILRNKLHWGERLGV
ncbi:MAG: NAD(+)/NADH kinase [Magnetococcales bacterium]|nr:NAD(+)/NADH kinase [Magnetococcales bacterium]